MFVDRKIFGVDLNFNQDTNKEYLVPITASSLSLPFPDKIFDIVTAVDVIEHIEGSKRRDAIHEMARVVKDDGILILSVPCDKYAEACDMKVNKSYKRRTGVDHNFIKEHLELRLPSTAEIREIFHNIAAKRVGGQLIISENTSVHLNAFIQRLLLGDINKPLNLILRVFLKILSPILVYIGNIGKCYRKTFVFKCGRL